MTFDDDCYGSEVKNPIWVAGNTFTLDPTNENYKNELEYRFFIRV